MANDDTGFGLGTVAAVGAVAALLAGGAVWWLVKHEDRLVPGRDREDLPPWLEGELARAQS